MSVVTEAATFHIKRYPSLFSSGMDYAYFVLCVLGNGYQWENGIPVSSSPHSPEWTPEREAERFASFNPELSDLYKEVLEQGIVQNQAIVDAADELALSQVLVSQGPYPQSSYALLVNLPEDIHPDWADMAEKVKAIAITHGWKF